MACRTASGPPVGRLVRGAEGRQRRPHATGPHPSVAPPGGGTVPQREGRSRVLLLHSPTLGSFARLKPRLDSGEQRMEPDPRRWITELRSHTTI